MVIQVGHEVTKALLMIRGFCEIRKRQSPQILNMEKIHKKPEKTVANC